MYRHLTALLASVLVTFGAFGADATSPAPALNRSSAANSDARWAKRMRDRHPILSSRLEQMKKNNPEEYERLMKRMKERRKNGFHHEGDAPPSQASSDIQKKKESLRQELQSLTERYRQAQPEEQAALRQQITSKASLAFDLTSQERSEAIQRSEQRLKEAQKALQAARDQQESRTANRDQHIQEFVNRLLQRPAQRASRDGNTTK